MKNEYDNPKIIECAGILNMIPAKIIKDAVENFKSIIEDKDNCDLILSIMNEILNNGIGQITFCTAAVHKDNDIRFVGKDEIYYKFVIKELERDI